MVEISKKLKDFLLQDSVKELINENDFEGLYKKVRGTCPVGELTQVLYAAGIDPLRYLVYIPDEFLKYSDIEHFTIPNHIKSVGNFAFYNCNNLTSVTILNGVTSIGSFAFYRCKSLTSITIPDSVTSINSYAFEDCPSLAGIVIPGSVVDIGPNAFRDCKGLTSVVIENGVESIGYDAFHGCEELMNVTIGSGVTEIGFGAFAGCTKLRKINYSGTMDQWKKIAVSNNNNKSLQDCKIICSDGNLKWDRTSSEWMEI